MGCIREGCTVDAAGHRLERFADRHLRAPEEMARLFAAYPEAVARIYAAKGRPVCSIANGICRSLRARSSLMKLLFTAEE